MPLCHKYKKETYEMFPAPQPTTTPLPPTDFKTPPSHPYLLILQPNIGRTLASLSALSCSTAEIGANLLLVQ